MSQRNGIRQASIHVTMNPGKSILQLLKITFRGVFNTKFEATKKKLMNLDLGIFKGAMPENNNQI